jgi:hypothetical protein
MISVSSCISVMARLDILNIELTCQNLIRLTMWLEERAQKLGGPLPTFLRAFHVDAEQHDLSIFTRPKRGAIFCPTIAPHHEETHGRPITRWWLGSSTDIVHAGPSLFRWDPRAGPTWIQVIFVWDPHQVGPTHISLWDPQFYWAGFMIKNLCFSHPVSGKVSGQAILQRPPWTLQK